MTLRTPRKVGSPLDELIRHVGAGPVDPDYLADQLEMICSVDRTMLEPGRLAETIERVEPLVGNVGVLLPPTFETHSSLEEVLGRVRDVLRITLVAVTMQTRPDDFPGALPGELVGRAAVGIEEERGVRVPIGTGFTGLIAALRRPVRLDDAGADTVRPHSRALRESEIKSLIGAPLSTDGSYGVIYAGSVYSHRFGERDLAVLELAARTLGDEDR